MALDKEIIDRISKLEKKYEGMGQDMKSYLDGLLYSNVISYWDYIHVDKLLALQNPKTDFPDEMIFIVYHQVTELYFLLVIHEFEQIAHNGRDVLETGEDKGWKDKLDVSYFTKRIKRVNRYFEALTTSFGIMVDGMEKEQFLRFRMALLPGSGFQAASYRKIEIMATDFLNLVERDEREQFNESNDLDKMFEHIYWKKGATELATGKKTLTLRQFEKKYSEELIELAEDYSGKNMWQKYKSLSEDDQKNEDLILVLRQLDVNVNINWPLVHYKSAARYLQQEESDIAATGGTNWQKYLPPKFQKRIFYPELWSDEEKEEWGKSWVESVALK